MGAIVYERCNIYLNQRQKQNASRKGKQNGTSSSSHLLFTIGHTQSEARWRRERSRQADDADGVCLPGHRKGQKKVKNGLSGAETNQPRY